MKKKICFVIILIALAGNTYAQGLLIQSGATFRASGNISIVVENGNIINNGNANLSTASVYLTKTSAVASLGGNNDLVFNNLYINKTSGTARLDRDISINNNLVFQNGTLNLNGNDITLANTAAIIDENNDDRITGNNGGEVIISANLNKPANINPGNLGAIISSAQNLGLVTIRRGHTVQTQNGNNKSIRRYFNITPVNNSNLNAAMRFKYFDGELNGLAESQLTMYRSNNNGTSWTNLGFDIRNASSNFVEVTGQASLRQYTLSTSSFGFGKTITFDDKESATQEELKTVGNFVMDLFPNPVTSKAIIRITSDKVITNVLNIVNIDGRIVQSQKIYLQKGINYVTVDVSRLANASYLAVIEKVPGNKRSVLFVKH